MICAKRRDARCECEQGKRRGTRDSTSRESIREKSRVGQLTRRRTISGSERRIKGAWEVERPGRIVEEGWYEKRRDMLLRVLPVNSMRVYYRRTFTC